MKDPGPGTAEAGTDGPTAAAGAVTGTGTAGAVAEAAADARNVDEPSAKSGECRVRQAPPARQARTTRTARTSPSASPRANATGFSKQTGAARPARRLAPPRRGRPRRPENRQSPERTICTGSKLRRNRPRRGESPLSRPDGKSSTPRPGRRRQSSRAADHAQEIEETPNTKKKRPRPGLPGRGQASATTYFPAEQYHRRPWLNCCVRDGNRCLPGSMVTDKADRGDKAATGGATGMRMVGHAHCDSQTCV